MHEIVLRALAVVLIMVRVVLRKYFVKKGREVEKRESDQDESQFIGFVLLT